VKRARWKDGRAVVNGWRLRVRCAGYAYWRWYAVGLHVVTEPVYGNQSPKSARRAAAAWARVQAFGGER